MWYSILPEGLTELESWIARFFLILGTLTIGPWFIFLLYDILLYIWRASMYEIPVIGGRARGRHRPVAPTLSERPDGRSRTLSLTREGADDDDNNNYGGDGAVRERKNLGVEAAGDTLADQGARERRVRIQVQGDITQTVQDEKQDR